MSAVGFANTLESFKSRSQLHNDSVEAKTINPGADIYFLLDMSKSMTEDDFNDAKRFIKALLPKVRRKCS